MTPHQTILRLIGIGRPKPKTRAGRAFRWAERAVVILCGAYLLLAAFPQGLFAHSIESNGITVHSRTPLGPDAAETMRRTYAAIRRSELCPEGGRFRVFICGSPLLYTFFAPSRRRSFAISNLVTDNIFVACADLDRDRAYRFADSRNERSFHSVAAHEITHVLIRRHIGRLRARRLPTWVKEGYCEYVAGESTFPDDEGTGLLLTGGINRSMAFRYFVWRKLVEYLIDVKGLTFSELALFSGDRQALEKEMVQWLSTQVAIEQPGRDDAEDGPAHP